MFVDADNGGKIGPVSFAGLGLVAAFYTDAAISVATPDSTGTVIRGGRSNRVVGSGAASRVIGSGASNRIIRGGSR